MSQYDPGDLESPLSGTVFINVHFEPTIDAINTSHSGNSRPSYAQAGLMWLNTTTTPWILNMFDGTDDIPLGTINATTNQFVPSNIQRWGGTSAGSANAKTLTPSPALGTLAAGVAYEFIVDTPNTAAAPTINISGTGAKTVKIYVGAAKANAPVGALQGICRIVYDGTDYVLINARPHLKSSDIATATTVNLDNANGDYVTLTGTTTVNAFTLAEGQEKTCIADGIFTMTDGTAASPQGIIIPGADDLTTAAGDVFVIRGESGGTTRIVSYQRSANAPAESGSGVILQIVEIAMGTGSTTLTTIPSDDTDPQATEGGQVWTGSITPLSASSTLHVGGKGIVGGVSGGQYSGVLFAPDGTPIDAIKYLGDSTGLIQWPLSGSYTPGSTSLQTFQIRGSTAEGSGGTMYWGDANTARFGNAANAPVIIITERA